MAYDLMVDGEYRGQFSFLDDVFYHLDSEFDLNKLDLYDEVHWKLIAPDFVVEEKTDVNMWQAHCEDPWNFKMWLEILRVDSERYADDS